MSQRASSPAADKPIDMARRQASKVQQTLQVAGAELNLTNTALDRHLPPEVRGGDVGRALVQNAAIEGKVQDAAEELAQVNALLREEADERRRLQSELDARDNERPG